jgi:hypothetical protein
MMSIWMASGSYRKNENISVYLDPKDPRKVATRDGFVSEDRLIEVPYLLAALGVFVVIVLLIALARRRRQPARFRSSVLPVRSSNGEIPPVSRTP